MTSRDDSAPVQNETGIVEIGAPEIVNTEFPDLWSIETSEVTKQDSINQLNFEKINYFDRLNGSKIEEVKKYRRLLVDNGETLDSLILLNSYFINNQRFEYVATYKTKQEKTHIYPLKINELSIVRFNKNDPEKKILVYSSRVSDYSIATKIGYLDSLGKLTMKEFNVEEINVEYKGQSVTDYHAFFD
jgi:hypothetical protein